MKNVFFLRLHDNYDAYVYVNKARETEMYIRNSFY